MIDDIVKYDPYHWFHTDCDLLLPDPVLNPTVRLRQLQRHGVLD